ncbi:hypothetical protein HU200_044016 [Digitaria exilis]|uniref:Uncharacterized protein n=1 Tax=Digitaria exilis TaxID=1010633 RepID=A0A835B2C9_9POAL|nr:hypothetical protein HU200_044016 [Digitaria exilis]
MESCDTKVVVVAETSSEECAAAAASKQQPDASQQAGNQAGEFVTDSEDDDDDAFATDSEDEDDKMSSMEYILTYKELPPSDVERILRHPVRRTPFADSYSFKALMATSPSATQEEIDVARHEYEENLDTMARFHDYVRGEYES